MIRINLLPLGDAQRALGRRRQLSVVALGAAIMLLIMVVPYVRQGGKLSTLDGQIAQLNGEIQRLKALVREGRDLDALKKDVEGKLRVIEALNHKRVGPARVLVDLSVATPDNLWLIDFTEVAGAASFTGMALDNETIARFMRQLQDSPYYHGVDLVETSRHDTPAARPEDAPPAFTRFVVKASIDYFGRDGKPSEAAPAPVGDPAAPPPNTRES
jgi:type IV pilus assembly protein PilN